jgi:PST family polysaccharide transporter
MGMRVVLTILSTAILARLLVPSDFGYVAMASLVTEIAALLSNIGIGAILIQKPRLRRYDLDTAFWLSGGLGTVITLLVIAVSFVADDLFKSPVVTEILWGLSVLFLLEEFSAVHQALLDRQLRFQAVVIIQLTNLVFRIFISVMLAFMGWGVWSLVLGSVMGRLAAFILAWYMVPYVPRLRIDVTLISQYWHTGGSYFGSGILSYFLCNIDYIIVGRKFGATDLGYYQVAFTLPEELRNRISGPLQKVLFPAYSSLQTDLPAFQYSVLKSLRLLSAMVVPLGVGLAATAEEVVLLLYGEKWLRMVPLLQILAIGGVLRAIFSLTASIYYAKNRPDLAFKINLVSAPFIVTAIYVGSSWGLEGVAWAMLLVQLTSLITARIALSLVGISWTTYFTTVIPVVVSSIIMVTGMISASAVLISLTTSARLICLIMWGALLYIGTVWLLDRRLVMEGAALLGHFGVKRKLRTALD